MPTFALRKGRQQGVACILAAQGLLALGLLWAGARLGSRTLLEQQPAYTFVEVTGNGAWAERRTCAGVPALAPRREAPPLRPANTSAARHKVVAWLGCARH